jgi:hypothetical protein
VSIRLASPFFYKHIAPTPEKLAKKIAALEQTRAEQEKLRTGLFDACQVYQTRDPNAPG